MDVDGNGTADALSDGILILRYLFDPSGAWNVNDALGSGAARTTREAIKFYLDQYNPSQAPPPGLKAESLADQPITQSAAISTAETSTASVPVIVTATSPEPAVPSIGAASRTSNDEHLAATIAPAILLAGVGADTNGGSSDHQEPQAPAADPKASDVILQQWNQTSPCPSRIEEPPTWINSSTSKDDAEAVDDLYGEGGIEWLLMKPGEPVMPDPAGIG